MSTWFEVDRAHEDQTRALAKPRFTPQIRRAAAHDWHDLVLNRQPERHYVALRE